MNAKWIIGIVAAAGSIAVMGSQTRAADDDTIDSLREQQATLDRKIQAERDIHKDRNAELRGDSAGAREEAERYKKAMADLQQRRAGVHDRIVNMKQADNQVAQPFENRIAADKDKVADENARHEAKIKELGAGTEAARLENEKHEANVRKIRESEAMTKEKMNQAVEDKADDNAEKAALRKTNDKIESERARHERVMNDLPAGSKMAKEEEEYHRDRLQQLAEKRTDIKETNKDLDAAREKEQAYRRELVEVNDKVAAENARHQKRIGEVKAGSEAARQENEKHRDALQRLAERRQDINDQIAKFDKKGDKAQQKVEQVDGR